MFSEHLCVCEQTLQSVLGHESCEAQDEKEKERYENQYNVESSVT